MDNSAKEIRALIKKIDECDEAYYNQNKSLITDPEYDALRDSLSDLTKAFSPSKKSEEKLRYQAQEVLGRVGAPVKKTPWNKYSHEVPMTSLNKVNTGDELDDWFKKDCDSPKLLFVTEKLDGLSVSLKYENGKLVVGATRGDGEVGEDITKNVLKMKGVVKELSEPLTIHVRGEIVLKHSDHKAHFADMANVRNAASGLAKRIEGGGQEHLTIFCYSIDGIDDLNSENDLFLKLKQLGFETTSFFTYKNTTDIKSLWKDYIDNKRSVLDYDIDGLVVRVNDLAAQQSLGEKGRGPKGAVAYKFETPEARTKICNIICQVGDTGQITPVAEFEPVQLLGATVRRASLHNFTNINTLGVDVGAIVKVKRANDVIPFISEVVTSTNSVFEIPDTCPECGAKTLRKGEHLRCTNYKTCPPQVKGRLKKWIKEHGILEWGDSILEKLLEAELISDVADLYILTKDDISSLDRMGDRSAEVLLNELDKYRSVPLENFIGGLCIENVATSTVKLLVDEGYDSIDKLMQLTEKDVESIDGFGEIKAKSFVSGLRDNADRIKAILQAGVKVKSRVVGVLTGLSFCFTGKSNLSRAELQKLVTKNGGEVKKSVGKGLNYLVTADTSSTSSKAQAAKKHGTKLLSEADFMKMIS